MSSICIKDNKEVLIDSSCTIITDCSEVNIRYDLKDGEYAILIFNDYKGNVTLHDSGRIENADVKINYLQLEAFDLKQDSRVYVEKGSSLSVNSTYLGFGNKNIVFDLYNNGSDSSIDIYNNIVCLEKSDFSMDCIGTIVKGAKHRLRTVIPFQKQGSGLFRMTHFVLPLFFQQAGGDRGRFCVSFLLCLPLSPVSSSLSSLKTKAPEDPSGAFAG